MGWELPDDVWFLLQANILRGLSDSLAPLLLRFQSQYLECPSRFKDEYSKSMSTLSNLSLYILSSKKSLPLSPYAHFTWCLLLLNPSFFSFQISLTLYSFKFKFKVQVLSFKSGPGVEEALWVVVCSEDL